MSIKQLAVEIEDRMIAIRRDLHRFPELSLQEYRTTKIICDTLKNTSIDLKVNPSGTGVVGVLKGNGEGPTIALRGDIDALPILEDTGLDFASENSGIMHACGHDIHTSVLLGAALVLDKLKDQFKGNIKFIFQPAEETMQGAKMMIEEGVLENVNHIVCLHTWPFTDAGKVSVKHGPIMASTNRFEIEVQGVSGHAAHPHKCIDPIPIAAQVVSGLQQIVSRTLAPLEPAVLTVGQIHGGTADNIIANRVVISGTVRTLRSEVSDKIKESMEEIAQGIAKSFKGKANVHYFAGSPPVINDPTLVNLLASAVTDTLGEERLEYLPEPSLGGEDFSFYLEHVDGMLFRLGTRNEIEASEKGLHNPSVIFDDEKAISTGIAAMSSLALKYFHKAKE